MARKAKARVVKPVEVWLTRLERLFGISPDHEGAAERIEIYADKVEADIGVRPVTLLDVQRTLAEIRGL
jgi:hypothetical protein